MKEQNEALQIYEVYIVAKSKLKYARIDN